MAIADLNATSPIVANLLRIESLARMGKIYSSFSEAELIGIETVLEMIVTLSTDTLAKLEDESPHD